MNSETALLPNATLSSNWNFPAVMRGIRISERRFNGQTHKNASQSVSNANIAQCLNDHFEGNLEGKRIAIWGAEEDELAIQAAVQTLRIGKRLSYLGADVVCHCGRQTIHGWNGTVTSVHDKLDAINDADALVILQPSSSYVGISSDPGTLAWRMNRVVVVDVWGCLDQKALTYGSAVYYNLCQT